jgi:hypothetical protein
MSLPARAEFYKIYWCEFTVMPVRHLVAAKAVYLQLHEGGGEMSR